MPRRQPFTLLCQATAKIAYPKLADLHAHTTASDGDYTPSQLVVHARNAGLHALAITDHDTMNGIAEATATAESFSVRSVEIIPGAELSTEHAGREFHVLAYFLDESNDALRSMLATIRQRRRERLQEFLTIFEKLNLAIPPHLLPPLLGSDVALGRRHLAGLLVASGHVTTIREAFQKYILPNHATANHRVAMSEAIRVVRDAGGITSLAHPPTEFTFENVKALADLGLDAIEANHPALSYSFAQDFEDVGEDDEFADDWRQRLPRPRCDSAGRLADHLDGCSPRLAKPCRLSRLNRLR